MNLRLHHVGIAVRDIARATEDHERRLGCRREGSLLHDPTQTALIQFLRLPGDSVLIELVALIGRRASSGEPSRRGGGLNHICYSTDDIESACQSLGHQGMAIIQEPYPAVGFEGRRIAWLMGEDRVLTELVERRRPDEEESRQG